MMFAPSLVAYWSIQAKKKQALLVANVSLEEYGSDVPCMEVSGLTGRGSPDLIKTLALMLMLLEPDASMGERTWRVVEDAVEAVGGLIILALLFALMLDIEGTQ